MYAPSADAEGMGDGIELLRDVIDLDVQCCELVRRDERLRFDDLCERARASEQLRVARTGGLARGAPHESRGCDPCGKSGYEAGSSIESSEPRVNWELFGKLSGGNARKLVKMPVREWGNAVAASTGSDRGLLTRQPGI